MYQQAMLPHYDDKHKTCYQEVLAVGWLDADHPFDRKICDATILAKLKSLLPILSINRTKGRFPCPFCRQQPLIEVNGRSYGLGSSELWLPVQDHSMLAAPDLILHYIEAHEYFPEPFIAAVMAFDADDEWQGDLAYCAIASAYHPESDLFIRVSIYVHRRFGLGESILYRPEADNFYEEPRNLEMLQKIMHYKTLFCR